NSMNNVSSAQLPKKMDPEEYDLVILGGGTGSTIAAWTFGKQGQRVAAIDRKYVGGSCPNIACLPSKNIIHSAKVASLLSQKRGVRHRQISRCDWRQVTIGGPDLRAVRSTMGGTTSVPSHFSPGYPRPSSSNSEIAKLTNHE